MNKVKFCGVKSIADVELMNIYMPDYVGFVFAKSKRQIDINLATALKNNLDKNIKTVGVFVDEDIDFILELCDKNIIDLIQLHGDESFEYIQKLRANTTAKIIKSVSIKNTNDIENANIIDCDYLLFDTYSNTSKGGTGNKFNWDILINANINKPYFLAGGINAENINEALKIKPTPYCYDLSSGIEKNGIKDNEMIKKFMANFKNKLD